MTALIVCHFVLAACAGPLVRRLGRRAFLVLALPPAAATVWAAFRWDGAADGRSVTWAWQWIPAYDVTVALRLDALAELMVLLAAGIGTLVLLYCASYFADDAPGLAGFAGNLLAFAGAMLALVLADDLITLYVFWELTTVFSFLLIGYGSEHKHNRRSALQALTVTTFGGLAMLVGFLIIGQAAGTYRISTIVADPPEPTLAVSVAVVLVLCGALSKSAIWPFSLWLPNAMAAPTPVSAYLHAAAMVKAGIYLVARLAPGFADVPVWQPVVLVLGSATMLLGGWRALRLHDLKLVLAYGTVSQLGFLTVLAGAGYRDAALAAAVMILGHALFKAPLFLVTGIVDHATGTRDLRRLSGVGRALPQVCAVAVLAAASMAALPPMLGFAAKEAAFEALLNGDTADRWALAATVVGSALTTAYTVRFVWGPSPASPASPTPPYTGSARPSSRRPPSSRSAGSCWAPASAGPTGSSPRTRTPSRPPRTRTTSPSGTASARLCSCRRSPGRAVPCSSRGAPPSPGSPGGSRGPRRTASSAISSSAWNAWPSRSPASSSAARSPSTWPPPWRWCWPDNWPSSPPTGPGAGRPHRGCGTCRSRAPWRC